MSILGRLFGGDAPTVDRLGRDLNEANIALCQRDTPATRAAHREALNAYVAAAPDSPLAREHSQRGADSRTIVEVRGVATDTSSAEYAAWYREHYGR